MNSKTNHIKPAFAPETKFQVETLTILHSDQTTDDSEPLGSLDFGMASEFVLWPRDPLSALND